MKTSWEKRKGKITHYIKINPDHLVSGSHAGSGHTDNAGTCTYDEFLNGQYHDIIIRDFGSEILEEVISSVNEAESWEPFLKKRAEIDERRGFIYNVPASSSLESLLHDPYIERGNRYYGIKGGYNTELVYGDLVFRTEASNVSHVTGIITHKVSGAIFDFLLPGYCTAVVAVNEKFFLISRNNFIVLDSRGETLFSTIGIQNNRGENLVGDDLRADTVIRSGESILVLFSWVGVSDRRSWLLFDPEKLTFTARYTEGSL